MSPSSTSNSRAIAALVTLSALLACGDSTNVLVPSDIEIVAGDAQDGAVGQPLEQRVRVRVLADGTPVPDVTVTFSADAGSMSPSSVATGADGTATSEWTLGGVSGRQTATASVQGLTASFSATARVGDLVSLAVAPPPGSLVALDDTMRLAAVGVDAFGNQVALGDAVWTSRDPTVATVDDAGLVTAMDNGASVVVAERSGLLDSVTVVVEQEAAAVTVIAGVGRVAWGGAVALDFEALDANGHEVEGATVAWSSSDEAIVRVDADGTATGTGLGEVALVAIVGAVSGSVTVVGTPVPDASVSTRFDGGCLLDIDGVAYCWGGGSDGQLGSGSFQTSREPVPVIGGHRFVALASSSWAHHCALTAAGQAYCWGQNPDGRLGDGAGSNSAVPVPVEGGHAFRSISAGDFHACALDDAGAAWCWGGNGYGQLGDGTSADRSAPVAVAGGLAFDEISAGGTSTCARAGGDVHCWGDNAQGQLGNGSTTPSEVPVQVSGGLELRQIASGSFHVCGVTSSDAVYCWGDNPSGAIGDGSTVDASAPTAVGGLPPVSRVAAGLHTTCAIADGSAWCWGENGRGSLGDGTLENRTTPVEVVGGRSWSAVEPGADATCGVADTGEVLCWGWSDFAGGAAPALRSEPVAVSGGQSFAALSAGWGSSCAATASAAWCWGRNDRGQLGLADSLARSTPTRIESIGLDRIDHGEYHACGLAPDGSAYCWGDGLGGRLGDGTTAGKAEPTAVDAAFAFSSLSVGAHHACAIRVSDGAAYCWGLNSYGQLGDGSTTHRSSPVAVAGGIAFAQISAGDSYTCGVADDGTVYCWGRNGFGQLGDGTMTDRSVPTAVSGGTAMEGVSAGERHTCGWTASNVGYCWGDNPFGNLGEGTSVDRLEPTPVAGGIAFASVRAGPLPYSCGVDTSGVGYCWGRGTTGALGNGTTGVEREPSPVSGGLTLARIETGWDHACALTTSGDAYCWGTIGEGALGDGSSQVTDPATVPGGFEVAVRE